MRKSFISILSALLLLSITIRANDPLRKETYTYSIKGTDTLRLDKYDLPGPEKEKPCIVFMFGGGFVGGVRDNKNYIGYFNHLANKGYTVVSIDYRLGMKNLNTQDPMRIVAALTKSISMAVEDLFDATAFVVDNAGDWNIDKDMIVANGSSAGAVSVLHGEYAICTRAKVTEKLPAGFNYAGIISFAGAIFSTDGELQWQTSPAPMQLFHGDADSNVPYDKIELYNYGFYGSKYIAGQLNKIASPYYFFDVKNAAHEISESPMSSNLHEIDSFLEKYVAAKQPLMIHTEVQQIGKPEMKKDFEMTDYIKTNFK